MLKQDVPSSSVAYELYLRANEMSRESKDWEPRSSSTNGASTKTRITLPRGRGPDACTG